ncbi:DUF429 domain-containing protein [Halococcoides cellulosivorans]|uniref:DUF429 domain-containing protein n=1 Tax=Halococcoides cellulosivorans TaxID=1679096 RepID=A0A2R4X2E1_9EURY|nr:DUF429 domain-containing protein [Halococcoides cellulosivorans]AWB27968.1 DUF429 domain-containing protein [Halococcoides cellulosivorans]
MVRDWTHVGVDRDGDTWLAVGITADRIEAYPYDSIDDLWDDHADAERIVVDVPIGLVGDLAADDPAGSIVDGDLERECDGRAREVVDSRSASVFTPPARPTVRAAAETDAGHATLSRLNELATGKGLSIQAASIADVIGEVDELLRDTADPSVLIEGHPEVAFRAFDEGPLDHSKHTAPGVAERLDRLGTVRDEVPWRRLARELAAEGHDAGLDDLLDALALAIVACAPDDEFHRLPSRDASAESTDDLPRDDRGLPMAIAYRRAEPFDLAQ